MELAHKLANFAEQLPIGKKLGELDFSHPGILIGETACGKSMVTPVLAYLTGGFKRIIVRQPTRLASYLAMKSMADIYGDSISVGCINRDQKINPDAPILEVTDGILIDWLRDKQIWYDELIILDEIHATSEQLEIAMGLIKRQGMQPWCLTATIDPSDIREYFQADVHYVSGINYPIQKKQVYKDLTDFFYGDNRKKGYIKEKILEQNHSCLVFLPTRFDTEYWAAELEQVYGEDIICKYIHGGIDVKEVAIFSHKEEVGKPFILLSTPVAEQSITLDLDDVVILNARVSVTEYMGVKIQQRVPLPPNSLIQMMGRCGRYREGHVYVVCEQFTEEIDFDELEPTAVAYNLSSNTPFELAIILADRQVNIDDVELITEVDRSEYDFAVKMLKKRKIIDSYGNLTKEGQEVMSVPLDYNLAQFVVTAPDEILDIVIAASGFGSHGIYHLEKMFPEGTPIDVLRARSKLAVSQSDLLTKYNIAREFYGLSEEEMTIKAQYLGLNLHVITNALNAAKSVYEHMGITPPSDLPKLNKQIISAFQEHVFNILLYPPIRVVQEYMRSGYHTYIDNIKAFTDNSSTIQGREKEVIFSLKTKVENRFGEWHIRLSDNTICPRKFWDWCWPEDTVRDFFAKCFTSSPNEAILSRLSRYPRIYEFINKSLLLSRMMIGLYDKSPGSFKNNRIKFMDIIEDYFMDICVDEKINNPDKLEKYLIDHKVNFPEIEDFISREDMERIKTNYPDEVEIRGNIYPLEYRDGEAFVELSYNLVLSLNDDEVRVNNFITVFEKNRKIQKLYSRGLGKAKRDILYSVTGKAWKNAEKSIKEKLKVRQIPDMLKKVLSQRLITKFQDIPVYGWMGIIYDQGKFRLQIFKSTGEAEIATRDSLIEYIRRRLQGKENEIRDRLLKWREKGKLKKAIHNEMKKILSFSIEAIKSEDFDVTSPEALNNLWKEINCKLEVSCREL